MRFRLLASTAIYVVCFVATNAVAQVADEPAAAKPQEATTPADAGEIIVTGSRIVTTGNQAPTPVTVLSPQKLLDTQPSNLGDALRQLPQFAADTAGRSAGPGSSVTSANTLNLRQFGANRNLVLFDGNRLAPATSSGAVDTNVIPQGLIKRVDVVTGGVSAVYGSDAITGVINFIVDRNFNGVKASVQRGISTYGDDASWKAGITAGTSLMSGRGHLEASYEHYQSDGLLSTFDRAAGRDVWTTTGSGTAAQPFDVIKNGRSTLFASVGALITSPGVLAGTTFRTDGVATPFAHGASPGIFGLESGGDGATFPDALIVPLKTDQAYGRFDYDLTDNIHGHVQGGYSTSRGAYVFFADLMFNDTLLSGNPFIPAGIQATMTANNIPSLSLSYLGASHAGADVAGSLPPITIDQKTQNILANAGLEGKLGGGFTWKLDYTFNRSIQHVLTKNNPNGRNIAAALDAVTAPNGDTVCAVSLTPSANLYPGCVAFNPFGPTAFSAGVPGFILSNTFYTLTNDLHDVNASVSGSPFSLWAGPVNIALNGEYRWVSITNHSNADPRAAVDCTGLRPTPNCTSTMALYASDVLAPVSASQTVKEAGVEALVPLLRDVPAFKRLDLNLAGRYTNYSVSGTVYTWKVGATWQVTNDLRVRGTLSQDIRAPTMYDLYAPAAVAFGGFTDVHTNTGGATNYVSQGNADLVPEKARTKTLGIVYSPSFLPRASFALDFYDININNAITSVNAGSSVIQGLCEASGGTSPYCSLYIRPLPFSDHTAANRPITVFNQSLNVARAWTRGVDAEANYSFNLGDVAAKLPGTLNLRLLGNYQPVLRTITIPGQRYTEAAGVNGLSKWRANVSANYDSAGLGATIVGRWQSSQHPTDLGNFVDLRAQIPAAFYADLSLSYHVKVGDHQLTPFLAISNLFNKAPPIIGGSTNTPGQSYPSANGFDVIGRYFTFGLRANF